ncbi:Clavaminate synthase-like protein [Fragilariopsis cylindrus CCMP1102]|uniref:Clavaminate synthase-like protein n=1 Tax=Fragilariopsis cylindrus CCMP1102 TaxID=635003 RepID=A0A1E7FXT4_9STRA|nr:Clavaminate synthase-like protein [Fragilariopsis cylindrus CCMP1102]|eukprot:OEU22944.1 Clavaminate synthase-like protein [Fragilariopsis cylindrus CCMP1102]
MSLLYPSCKIPSVDLKPFFEENGCVIGDEPTKDQLLVAETINKICHEHGFIHIRNFGLTKKMGDTLFNAAKELFDSPNKESDYTKWSSHTNTGYSSYRSESLNKNRPPELKEAFNIKFPPTAHITNPSLPHTPLSFQNIVDEYTRIMKVAAIRYGMACALALDLPIDFFTKTLNTFDSVTSRFLHYPPCDFHNITQTATTTNNNDKELPPIRVSEHTDFGCYTFLLLRGNQGPMGLQVKPGQRGGEIGGIAGEHDDEEEEEPFGAIINTGAMMARMTNDYWKATPHRVIVPSAELASKHRYSIAFFVDPDSHELIEVDEKYADWNNNYAAADNDDNDEKKTTSSLSYEPITSKDFILKKLKEMEEGGKKA